MPLSQPFIAALAASALLPALLAAAHSTNPQAASFAAAQHERCLRHFPAAAPELCAARTIQLASHLHGIAFADQVAQALR